MKVIPSKVYGASADVPGIGYLLPSFVPTPEQYVYDYVRQVCGVPVTDPTRPSDVIEWGVTFPLDIATPFTLPLAFDEKPPMTLYDEANTGDPRGIPTVRGWPAYPGKVPMIGIAEANKNEDGQSEAAQGGFAGEARYHDAEGNLLAVGDYYAEPLTASIVVELIHENRDERDRLYDELQRALFPLRHRLIDRCVLIRRVRIDGEKDELPLDEQPMVIYIALFTVQVSYEMLLAQDVTGPDGTLGALDISLLPDPMPTNQSGGLPTVIGGIQFGITLGSEASPGATFPFQSEGLSFGPQTTLQFPVAPDTGP